MAEGILGAFLAGRMEGRRDARSSFEDFEQLVQQFTNTLTWEARVERGRGSASRRFPLSISERYRTNRSAVAKEILQRSPPCPIPLEELHQHFTRLFARDDGRGGAPRPANLPRLPRAESHAVLSKPITLEEVSEVLQRTKNSTPGRDEIGYAQLKRLSPERKRTLVGILEHSRRVKHTPASWKRAQTVLKFKQGDVQGPSNWRPITMCNTMYRLYAKCLARRVSQWAEEGEALSPQQKGFQAQEGCTEHHFLLQAVLDEACSSRRECALAWLDLADAYTSIPRCHVFETLAEFGMPPAFLALLRELYSGCTTTIKVRQEETAAIPLRTGLKQGCPLSSILFQLALEPLLRFVGGPSRGFRLYGVTVGVLAYADDLVLVAENARELQAMLDDATAAANWIGLRFKAAKCKSLHCRGGTNQATEFRVQGEVISCLGRGEAVQYLGRSIGFHTQPETLASAFEADVDKIEESKLRPWQKADMVRRTLVPKILSALRDRHISKKDLSTINSEIERALSKWDYNYQRDAGELTLSELSDIEVVTHTFLLLSSPDRVVKAVAFGALEDIVHESFTEDPDGEALALYLSGFGEDQVRHRNGHSTSVWARARYATRRLCKFTGCQWIDRDGKLCLRLPGRVISSRKTLGRALKQAVRRKKEERYTGNCRAY